MYYSSKATNRFPKRLKILSDAYSCVLPPWRRIHNAPTLHQSQTQADEASPAVKEQETEKEHHKSTDVGEQTRLAKAKRRKARKAALDIHPNDLEATLEAHRRANRLSIIRRFPLDRHDSDPSPALPKDNEGDAIDDLASDPPRVFFKRGRSRSNRIMRGRFASLSRDWTAPRSFESRALLRPWQISDYGDVSAYDISAIERFEKGAKRFLLWMTSTRQEELAIEDLRKAVFQLISSALPTCDIRLHGSRAAGLNDPVSDLNICVNGPILDDAGRDPRKTLMTNEGFRVKVTEKLREVFRGSERFTHVTLKYFPEVHSVLQFRDTSTGINVMVIAGEQVLHRNGLIRDLAAQNDQIAPIYYLLRQALTMRGLIGLGTGGISSYTLFNMITLALRSRDLPIADEHGQQGGALPVPSDPMSSKILPNILHVLNFWEKQDLSTNVFVVDPPRLHDKFMSGSEIAALRRGPDVEELFPYLRDLSGVCKLNRSRMRKYSRHTKNKKSQWSPSLLCLLDPAKPVHDLGRSSEKISQVLALFKNTRLRQEKKVKQWDQATPRMRLSIRHNILDTFAFGNWNNFYHRRQKLYFHGIELESQSGNTSPSDPEPQADILKDVEMEQNCSGSYLQATPSGREPTLSPSASDIRRLIKLEQAASSQQQRAEKE